MIRKLNQKLCVIMLLILLFTQYFAITQVFAEETANIINSVAYSNKSADATKYLSKHQIVVDGNQYGGQELDSKKPFGVNIEFSFTFDDIVTDGLSYNYALPEHISIGNVASEDTPEILYNEAGERIGTYYYKENIIYFSFDNNSSKQIAYFNLEASWDNVEGVSEIPIKWNDGDEIVKFDIAQIKVSKYQGEAYMLSDGRIIKKYEVRISPKDENAGSTIKGIAFRDLFYGLSHSFAKDVDEKNKDIAVKEYDASDKNNPSKVTWYDFDTIGVTQVKDEQNQNIGGKYEFSINNLEIKNGGEIGIEYYVELDKDKLLEADAGAIDTYHDNEAIATYEMTNQLTGEKIPINASTKISGFFNSSSQWIMKEAGEPELYVKEGEHEVNRVKYTLQMNTGRNYSLGGGITGDQIKDYTNGEVVYDTDSQAIIEKYKGWGDLKEGEQPVTDNLDWIILQYSDYQLLKHLQTESEDVAMNSLLNETENATLRSKLLNAINKKSGTNYKSLTDDIVSKYIFTFEPKSSLNVEPNFVWVSPLDKDGVPTRYRISYYTLSEKSVGTLKNGASFFYKNYAKYGGPGSPVYIKGGIGFSKENEGVYKDENGNFCVDWTLGVELPKGTAGFKQILIKDYLQGYENVPIGENRYYVSDWIKGFENYSVSKSYEMQDAGKQRDYIREISEKIIKVSSSNKSQEVQEAVNRAEAFFWYSGYAHAYPKDIGNEPNVWDIDANHCRASGHNYTGEARGAGQIISDSERMPFMSLGDTFTPQSMYIHLGDIPASEDGYKIEIKYTTIINPELINALPDILEEKGEDYISLYNEATLYEAREDGDNYQIWGYQIGGTLSCDYYIGVKELLPAVEKEGNYNDDNTKIEYKLSINPGRQVKGENKKYVVDDGLGISGLKYDDNSFVLYDPDGKVAYSTDSSKTVDNKYKNLVTLQVNNYDNKNSGFKLVLNNATGAFTDSEGKLKVMELKYTVGTSGLAMNTIVQNSAELSSIEIDGETGKELKSYIGSVISDTHIDGPVMKRTTNVLSLENSYNAQFELSVNLDSHYADNYLKNLKAGDIFTIKDTLEQNLLLDVDSIQILEYNAASGKYEKIENGYILKFDDMSNELSIDITVKSGVSRYLVRYNASVVGKTGKFTTIVNKAKVEDSTVEEYKYEAKIFKYSYGAGAIIDNKKITLIKYDKENLENRLPGAEFELYELNDTTWENITTTENGCDILRTENDGKVEISNQLSQTKQFVKNDKWYKLEETKAPNDYTKLNKAIYYYVTNENGDEPSNIPEGVENYRIIDSNENIIGISNKKSAIEIIKTDSFNGTLISGAEFKVYSDSNCKNEVATSKETETGKYLIENIAIGDGNKTVYLKETKAPRDYQLDKRVYKIVLKAEKIEQVVSTDNNKNLEFSNEQEISSINFEEDSNTGKIRIEKNVISNIEAAKNSDFEFTIELKDSANKVLTESYPTLKTKKDGTTEKGTIQSGNKVTIKDSENILINDLPDGAKYTITESEYANYKTSYSINDSKNENNVQKTDGKAATGIVNIGGVETVTFENKQCIETTIQVYKELNVGNLSNLPEFEFELKQENKRLQTARADKTSGLAEFSIQLTEPGTYEYEVKEIIPENKLEYVEYSTQTIHITVTVSTEANGNIIANTTYVGGTGTNKNVITNKYIATGKFTLEATKKIEGYEAGHNLENNLFEFEIYENNKLIATASNDANGSIKFPGIVYELSEAKNDVGKHTYKIIEKDGKLPGYTYDKTEYTVEFNVEDQGDGNLAIKNVTGASLVADNKYQLNKETAKTANFVNTYDAEGTLEIEANKVVTDLEKGYSIKNLKGNEFEFTLYEKGENNKLTEVCRAKNNANGKVTMPAIEYRMINLGKHTYLLKENADLKMPGVVNSSEEVTIEVNVTNNGDGTLQVEKTYKKDNKTIQNIVFTNTTTKVKFAKTDITTGENVVDAKMEIRNAANEVVETWTTTNEEHYVYALPVGKYTLVEIQAPTKQGYVHVENVEFEVLETGDIQSVEMKDDYTKVSIKKIDFATGQDIIGATLQILDEEGKAVEAYNSEGTEKVTLEWTTEAKMEGEGVPELDEEGNEILDEEGNVVLSKYNVPIDMDTIRRREPKK